MLFILFYSIIIFNVSAWTPNSWKTKHISQIPIYDDNIKLNKVIDKINNFPPIIFAGECDILKTSIMEAGIGKKFILIGGDCAEVFDNFNTNKVRDTLKLLLQMGLILTYGSGIPTVKIGRIAGQFAKPRSEEYENINNNTVLTYRGDIINGYDYNDRTPNPDRMLDAYHQSVQTLNILRAFSQGGFADVKNVNMWNSNFIDKTKEDSEYRIFAEKVTQSLKFIHGLGININSEQFSQTYLFTAHECLLLHYEQALTRVDSRTSKIYDCSAHLLWLGERTRQLDSAHVEFLRGINNPIGIKISDKVDINELIKLIKILNPFNIPGRILLMTRMGAEKIKYILPNLIRKIQNEAIFVTWCCDPMHANTIKTNEQIKTRNFVAIKNELIEYFKIHKKHGSYPGGIHLELTPENVTECIGGEVENIKENDLNIKYDSKCDPRLNYVQSLELAFLVSNLLAKT
jgi:3-deoxy-7-phosphoheptulonate synthase